MTRRVYVHVGPFKTGSTYLQGSLRARRRELADQGVLFPLAKGRAHQRAAVDLLGRSSARRSKDSVKGGWDDAVAEIQQWDGDTAVLSCEVLSAARSPAVERAVTTLAPAEVHIVATLRNLASLIPSFWQSNVRNRKSVTWAEFMASLRGDESASEKYGERFWRSMDVSSLLRQWSERVPTDRLHVVVMPPSGSPPELLWERFLQTVDVKDVPPPATESARNVAVGTEQAEALRRLNAGLAGKYPDDLYVKYVKRVATSSAVKSGADARKMVLPPEDFEWVRGQSQRIVDDIVAGGYPVVGDLAEAVPVAPSVLTPDGPFRPDDVRPEKVLEAMTNMSVGLLLHLRDADKGAPAPAAAGEDELNADLTESFAAALADASVAPPAASASPSESAGDSAGRPAIERIDELRAAKLRNRRAKRRARRTAS